jgi:serine phosphatase RsbU (regulator of sigma subunit)
MLAPGSQIYLFSDGFADQFGGPKEKKFKYAQLKEQLLLNHQFSMERQHCQLEKAHLEWKGNYDQTDDVLLIGLKV